MDKIPIEKHQLFNSSDFHLFADFQDKYQRDYPDAYEKMQEAYQKLGKLADYLVKKGYKKSRMMMKPTNLQQKYSRYHWSKLCFPELFSECDNKIFFVVGTNEDGVYIEINYNEKDNSLICSDKARMIKKASYEIIPNSYRYSLEELADICINYFNQHKRDFLLFAKEFNIQKAIQILSQMEINEIKSLLLANHNIILTGAPGTGKTYLAKEIAKSIGCDKDHLGFVQFHPSYDYTDFVEGLRPIKDGNTLGFQRKDGVFKEFCKKAFRSSFKDPYLALKQFKKDITVSINIPYISSPDRDPFAVTVDENNKLKVSLSNENDNPQSATDEDVINSIEIDSRPGNKTYAYSIGVYIKEHYMNNKPYVFIIDEINRGEISKIFGELFYSIDAGYRGEKGIVNTQYQNLVPEDDVFYNGFYIPENVYIIGTMNDIDRSVESMDFAMRRRFAWKEITAVSRQSMLDDAKAWGANGKPSEEVIAEMKVRMDNLNLAIIDQYADEKLSNKDKVGLTKAYQIGAAYFLKYALYNDFDELWTNHLEGLLYEYLRGKTNIDEKIKRLRQAYNDKTKH